MVNIKLKSGSQHLNASESAVRLYKKEEIAEVYDLHFKRKLTQKEIDYLRQYLEWEATDNVE